MHRVADEELLRSHGLRITRPRVAVLRFLRSTTRHPTADEVGAAVPSASRASVYNVLHRLRDAGLVEELVFGDAVARYDANLGTHHHFVCRKCHAVEDLPASFGRLGQALAPAPPVEVEGRRVERLTVTLSGLCAGCV